MDSAHAPAASAIGAFLPGWPSIIPVIMNHVTWSETRGTWRAGRPMDV